MKEASNPIPAGRLQRAAAKQRGLIEISSSFFLEEKTMAGRDYLSFVAIHTNFIVFTG